MATSWPTNFPVFDEQARKFARYVSELSQGVLHIDVDSASKHKAPYEVFDLVQSGQYQMGHSASYYWKGKDSAFAFLTTIPFGMTAIEQTSWFLYGGGDQLMEKLYDQYGLISLNAGNTGVQMGGWFQKKIESLKDLQGLKMRIPGLAGEVISRLGVQVVNLPVAELYQALERKVIDALEWVGPHLDLAMGFQEIAKYYYTGWHEPAAELQILINKNAYQELPPYLQQIIRVAARAISLETWCAFTATNAESFSKMKQQYPDIEILTFPDEILRALKSETIAVLEETASQNATAREIWESYKKFYKTVAQWTEISTTEFLRVRNNPFIFS